MRASSAIGLVMSLILLGACGRSADDTQRTQANEQPVAAPSLEARANDKPAPATRSLGQPRLSRLIANPPAPDVLARPPEPTTRPPAATFSQYDGRLPGDASVPLDVPVRTNAALAARVPEQDSLPPRDVVDVGLDRAVTANRPAAPAPPTTQIASISRTPAPTPRPISSSPRPVQRPVAQSAALQTPAPVVVPAAPAPLPIAPALPPQPTIAALGGPGLSAPATSLDTPPTGLPVLRSVEQAVPLGTVPASLGVANIEAGEAALPAGDQLEQSVADEGGSLSWTQAASLIRAGEVESTIDIGEFEVLLQLCSGRGVISIQPTPTALADIEKPKVVCGKSVSLTSQ